MTSGFLTPYIDSALQLHSQGWKSWAQGEPLHTTSEWLAQHISKFPKAAKSIATILNNKVWDSGETLDRWVGPSVGDQNLLQNIQILDEDVLRALSRKGFLTHTPKVSYVWSETHEQTAGQNIPHSDGWGEIKMFIKTSGRLVSTNSPPNSIEHQMNKWLVLFHEASHNEFYTSFDIFVPQKGFRNQEVQLINDWGMNRLFCSRASLMLSEAFSDCYGSMMLLEGFGHTQNANNAVENLMRLRSADENSTRPTVMYSLCATALRSMWENRSQWMGKSPQEIKHFARVFSSNSLVEVGLNPCSKTDNVLDGLVEDKMRIQPFMFEFCLEYISHTSESFLEQMDKKYSSIPMWPHIKKLCEGLRCHLDNAQISNQASELWNALSIHKDVDSHVLFKYVQQPLSQYLKRALIELSGTPDFIRDWGQYTLVKECISSRVEVLQSSFVHKTSRVQPSSLADSSKIRVSHQ
jgi:hypothetical protein